MKINQRDKSDNGERKPIRGVSEIKTPIKMKMTTRPKTRNAEYLNLYLAHKEKDRNMQEMRALSKRQNQLKDNMEFLDEHTDTILKELIEEGSDGSVVSNSEVFDDSCKKECAQPMPASTLKKWKTIEIDY